MHREYIINGCRTLWREKPTRSPPTRFKSLTQMGYRVVPLEPMRAGNAAEAIGHRAPRMAAEAKALGFPRPGILYGASDSRAPRRVGGRTVTTACAVCAHDSVHRGSRHRPGKGCDGQCVFSWAGGKNAGVGPLVGHSDIPAENAHVVRGFGHSDVSAENAMPSAGLVIPTFPRKTRRPRSLVTSNSNLPSRFTAHRDIKRRCRRGLQELGGDLRGRFRTPAGWCPAAAAHAGERPPTPPSARFRSFAPGTWVLRTSHPQTPLEQIKAQQVKTSSRRACLARCTLIRVCACRSSTVPTMALPKGAKGFIKLWISC